MFGKKSMTPAGAFIMARGKAVGNLKDAGARPGKQPPKKVEKVVAASPRNRVESQRTEAGKMKIKVES